MMSHSLEGEYVRYQITDVFIFVLPGYSAKKKLLTHNEARTYKMLSYRRETALQGEL